MNPDSFKYLEDILNSIEIIKSHLTGIKTFSEYTSNFMLIDAVDRRLDKDIRVTDQKKIIGLRHILVHDYDLIDNASIWKIVHNNLETLKEELQKYLDK